MIASYLLILTLCIVLTFTMLSIYIYAEKKIQSRYRVSHGVFEVIINGKCTTREQALHSPEDVPPTTPVIVRWDYAKPGEITFTWNPVDPMLATKKYPVAYGEVKNEIQEIRPLVSIPFFYYSTVSNHSVIISLGDDYIISISNLYPLYAMLCQVNKFILNEEQPLITDSEIDAGIEELLSTHDRHVD